MARIVHLSEKLKPQKVKNKHSEPLKSIISEFIKKSEKKLPADRQHVDKMGLFDGSTELAYKGPGDFGFFTAVYECYNNHWALRTVPDDWWYTIIRTVAMAIDDNSKEEKVRKFFVDHEGKKRLTVDIGTIRQPGCIDYEAFFRQMTNLIQAEIKTDGYVDTIRSDFSTSTSTHRIVSEITVMSSMQEFFEYCMHTKCGIPYVELLGSEEDWERLKMKFVKLKEMLQPIEMSIGLSQWEIGGIWWNRVEMICDKLIESAKGKADKEWWSNIFHSTYHRGHGFGSGSESYTTYDGWFIRDLLNISNAGSLASLPSGLVSVPLIFDDVGVESNGAIVSGVAGIKIDDSKDIPIVESVHGWAIFDENAKVSPAAKLNPGVWFNQDYGYKTDGPRPNSKKDRCTLS